ncbi:glycosyltransferase family 4 protein [Ornithinibacillus halotolerans]|uniref:Glycosyl transferase n=1 Tax=Ornithinibacillus halotolerans TaxID=1274357 RepID=A0A916SAC9_9BACI|nr:glycosyltransferase family 1 protein [Ornithinibacillus halotolerans]GGA89534.1 glycosyl transferase [Ornithinibacillus halotolerans]
MKIAIFTDTFAPDVNGVAKTLKRFTNYLEQKGHEYRVYAPTSSIGSLYSNDVHRFKSLPFFLYPECRLALPNMLQVKEELIQFQPDMIHVATPFNVGLCGLHYAKKLNIPLVGSYHTDFDKYLEYYDLQFLTKILWRYMRWFHRPMQKIFVPSIDTKEHLSRRGFTKLDIWPRGIDCSLFHPNYNKQLVRDTYHIKEDYILLYVGRLAPEKDVLLLPEIHAQLPERMKSQVHWLVVGEGPEQEKLRKKAPKQMTFTGFLTGTELAHVYVAADLFVFPSPTETFGNVVLESLASSTPAICANSGGVRTIVIDQETGILCEKNNSTDFAKAIESLITNEVKRKQMGVKGRQYAVTQSWDRIFDELIINYEAVLKKKQMVLA